jgi:hypothetical protein
MLVRRSDAQSVRQRFFIFIIVMPFVGIGDEIGDKRNGDDLTRSKFLTCISGWQLQIFIFPLRYFV